jgi:hypothetical protein
MAKARTHHREDCPTVKPGVISRWEEGCIICDSLDATDRRTRERMKNECFTHQDDLIKDIRKGVKRLPVRYYYIPDGGYWAEPKYWVTVDSVIALLDKMEGSNEN